MKKMLMAILMAVFCVFIYSCNKSNPEKKVVHDDSNTTGSDSKTSKSEVVFKLDKSTLNFAAEGGKQTLVLSSSKDWTASSSQSWLKLSPTSSKGSSSPVNITVSVDSNMSFTARTAEIKILDKTISVSQEGLKPTVTLNTNQDQGKNVTLQLYSSTEKTALVDWGDGSALATLPLGALNNDPGNAKRFKGAIVTHSMLKKGAVIKVYGPGIEGFKAPSSWLTGAEFSAPNNIKLLSIERNGTLTSLDLSSLTNLQEIYIWNNTGLSSLTLGNMPNLTEIDCYFTKLKSLDLSNYPKLTTLSCENNPGLQLTFGAKNTALSTIWLYNNKYSGEELNKIYNMLPTVSGRTAKLYPTDSKVTDNANDLSSSDISIAIKKGWSLIEHGSDKPITTAHVLYSNNFDAAELSSLQKVGNSTDPAVTKCINTASGDYASKVELSLYSVYSSVAIGPGDSDVPSSAKGSSSFYDGSGKNCIVLTNSSSDEKDGIKVGPFKTGDYQSFSVSFGLLKSSDSSSGISDLLIYLIDNESNYTQVPADIIKTTSALSDGKWSLCSFDFKLKSPVKGEFTILIYNTTEHKKYAIDDLKVSGIADSSNEISM